MGLRAGTAGKWRAATLALGVLTAACGSDYPATGGGSGGGGPRADGGRGEPRSVRTVRVAEVRVGQSVVVTGTLSAYDEATVTAKVPGRLAVVAVDLGSRVRKGQVLARIDAADYRIRVQQAQASLAEARARAGLADGSVDPRQSGTVRAAQAVLEAARASHERAAARARAGVIA